MKTTEQKPNPPKIVEAVVSYDGIKAGTQYEVLNIWNYWDDKSGYGFVIKDDDGFKLSCFELNCLWQDDNDWKIIQREGDDQDVNEKAEDEGIRAAAPELLEALKEAQKLFSEMRKYLPKSVKNQDRFRFENVNANVIGKAIDKATNHEQ